MARKVAPKPSLPVDAKSLDALAEQQRQWQRDPIGFIENVLGGTLWEKQREIAESVRDNYLTVVASGHACFGAGTLIRMWDGSTKAAEDIAVGDVLHGDDGTPRTVHELYSGREALYEFTFVNGLQHVYNASHILCLQATQGHGRQRFWRRHEATVADFLSWSKRKRQTNGSYFGAWDGTEQALPIDPWLLGFWLGDGCESSSDFCNIDPEALWLLEQHARRIGGHLTHAKNGRNHYIVGEKRRNPWLALLRSAGLFRNKHIPEAYFRADRNSRLLLLAGLIDSDGHRCGGGTYELTQKRQSLAEQIARLAKSLGFGCSVRKKTLRTGPYRGRSYYRTFIAVRSGDVIPVVLPRKMVTSPSKQKNVSVFGIRSVRSLGVGDYYGFAIDGNRRFLHADGTVLHNTGKDWLAGRLMTWFFCAFPNAIITATGPTIRQVETILFGEMRSAIAQAEQRGLPFGSDKLSPVAPMLRLGPKWYAEGIVPKTHDAFTGRHSDYNLVVIDEAAKLPRWVWDGARACTVNPKTDRILAIGNPLCGPGDAFWDEGHKANRPGFHKVIHVSSEETPNARTGRTVIPGLASKEWVAEQKEALGETSDLYRAKVLGQFSSANSTALITPGLVQMAFLRYEKWTEDGSPATLDKDGKPVEQSAVLGVDCGRLNDPSTFCIIRGNEPPVWPSVGAVKNGALYPKGGKPLDGPTVAEHIGLILQHYAHLGIRDVAIDEGAVGASPIDALRGLVASAKIPFIHVHGNQFGAQATNPKVHNNRRSELYDRGREHLLSVGMLDQKDATTVRYLVGELTEVGYKFVAGRLNMEEKATVRKRLGRSTDYSDAYLLALHGAKGRRSGAKPVLEWW